MLIRYSVATYVPPSQSKCLNNKVCTIFSLIPCLFECDLMLPDIDFHVNYTFWSIACCSVTFCINLFSIPYRLMVPEGLPCLIESVHNSLNDSSRPVVDSIWFRSSYNFTLNPGLDWYINWYRGARAFFGSPYSSKDYLTARLLRSLSATSSVC